MPSVTLRYFATLRERRGCEQEQVLLPDGATPASAWQQVFGASPEVALRVMYAVNHSYADADQPLHDGDELAFIPPLGGG